MISLSEKKALTCASLALFLAMVVFFFYIVLVKTYKTDFMAHSLFALSAMNGQYSGIAHPAFIIFLVPIYYVLSILKIDKAVECLGLLDVKTLMAVVNKNYIMLTDTRKVDLNLQGYEIGDIINACLSGILVVSFFLAGCFLLTYLAVRLMTGMNIVVSSLLTFIVGFSSAIYFPYNQNIYVGQGSPNVWHSPTAILVKPFSIIVTILFVYLILKKDEYCSKIIYISAAGLLALSCFIKPNFSMVFIPALLFFLVTVKELSQSNRIFILSGVTPALIVLVVQYLYVYAGLGGEQSQVVFSFFGFWSKASDNILLSIGLALGFPLVVSLSRASTFLRRNYFLSLSWLMVFVGFAQGAFLVEYGSRFNDGNFLWGYILALYPLYLFSVIEYVRSWEELPQIREQNIIRHKVRIACCVLSTLFLFLHFFSGIYYVIRIATGMGYY